MNKVLITGRLTRDPELRVLASGKSVCQFSVATNEYAGNGKEKAEYQCKGKVYPRDADSWASMLRWVIASTTRPHSKNARPLLSRRIPRTWT